MLRRPSAASVAASVNEIADAFFFVLKLNLDRGSNAARVSFSLSWSALMAWRWLAALLPLFTWDLLPPRRLFGHMLGCSSLHL